MATVALTVRFIVFFPNTEAVAQTLLEVAFVMAAILPEVLAVAIRQAIDV